MITGVSERGIRGALGIVGFLALRPRNSLGSLARGLLPTPSWAGNLLVRCRRRVRHYSVTDFAGAHSEAYVPAVIVLKEMTVRWVRREKR